MFDISAFFKEKWEEFKRERRLAKQERKKIKEKVLVAKYEAEANEAIKTARYKERLKGEQDREYYKEGGFLGKISKLGESLTPPPSKEGNGKSKKENPFDIF